MNTVADLLIERGVLVKRPIVFHWARKFGPEVAKRAARRRHSVSPNWHVDGAGGNWHEFWRALDAFVQRIGFGLTTRRDTEAVGAFFAQGN